MMMSSPPQINMYINHTSYRTHFYDGCPTDRNEMKCWIVILGLWVLVAAREGRNNN